MGYTRGIANEMEILAHADLIGIVRGIHGYACLSIKHPDQYMEHRKRTGL